MASNPGVATDSTLSAELEQELQAMDSNGDGVIDYEEFRAAVAPASPSPQYATPRSTAGSPSPSPLCVESH